MFRKAVTALAVAVVLAASATAAYAISTGPPPHSPATFQIAGGVFTVNGRRAVVLGWRSVQPGPSLEVIRDGARVYIGANPQAVPFNVYLYSQPAGEHGYQVCTGSMSSNRGFAPQACSQALTLTVT